jgi:hypothetical protein
MRFFVWKSENQMKSMLRKRLVLRELLPFDSVNLLQETLESEIKKLKPDGV